MPNVLVLCTGNSARSILAEALLNQLGKGVWRGFSAGSKPVGRVNPYALALLETKNHDIAGLSSKSWDVFAAPGAPSMDLIITVCDSAAGESCPVWPGHSLVTHWGMPDPASLSGGKAEIEAAFAATYDKLHQRISALVTLPLNQLTRVEAKAAIDGIGRA